MSLHKSKPTSAGRRFQVAVRTPGLHKGKPHEALVDKKSKSGGRNNNGRITVRHHGGGHKQRYRIIDFKRDKDGVPGVVERLEYDPNRSAHIALDQVRGRRASLHPGAEAAWPRGRLSPAGTKPRSSRATPCRLKNIPVGTLVHNIEMKPGKGGQLVRSAGGGAQLAAREGVYATIRLRSGEMRRIHADCRATVGEVGHGEHNLRKLGKAGRQALARCQADRARCRHEPGGSSARRR